MALYEEFEPAPNRLIDAQSAYLRSAAYQPIGWFEYGPEAFDEARRQNKPLLLDIGAVWCHWCHVIDRESYEDPEIATLINEHFIPVKVDRDERPDIDARYQVAVQLLTGQGGWPLTVFLTPEGKPFYGGTYFPAEDRHGRMGMKTLLPRVAHGYRHNREQLEETANTLLERAHANGIGSVAAGAISDDTYRQIFDGVRRRFNPDQGGFERSSPKFPHAGAIEVALLQWDVTRDDTWRTIVEKTLTEMGQGGIYDQLGGGFHRYSTDDTWTVPHFEKMSYDNAVLLENYVHAYRAFGVTYFREIAEGTLDFLLRDFADQKRGGFYGSQDADNSLHDDGDYWTWTPEELGAVLTPDEAQVLARYYGVGRRGNMPESDRSVLRRDKSPVKIAHETGLPLEKVQEHIDTGRRKLLEARNHRKTPRIDTDKYANWNGMLIAALLETGILLDRADATRFALRTLDVMLHDDYDPDHGFYHNFHSEIGARLPGFLDDQVFMARALLEGYSVSGKAAYLDAARRVMDLCLELYWDEEHGGFLDVERDRLASYAEEFMRAPRKVIEDMPAPAANAVAALVLDRLWLITGDDRYHEVARRTLETFATHAPGYGPFASFYGLAVYYHLHPPAHAVVVGGFDEAQTAGLRQAALSTYRPGRLVMCIAPGEAQGHYQLGPEGKPVAYVCAGQTCSAPSSDPATLQETLRTFGKPAA